MRLRYGVMIRLGARTLRALLLCNLHSARASWALLRLAAVFHLVPANSEEV